MYIYIYIYIIFGVQMLLNVYQYLTRRSPLGLSARLTSREGLISRYVMAPLDMSRDAS